MKKKNKELFENLNLHEVELFVRIYDDEFDESGNKKPNRSLGVFLMTDEWEKKMYQDYRFRTFAIKDNELYMILGKEVSGYIYPGEGGTRLLLEKISENNEIVKAWEIFRKYQEMKNDKKPKK